jgi:ABC-type Fe3+/spermidine/putrescine transport system ATPase subunit
MTLKISKVCKRYGYQNWALRDISLEIERGEIVGLIGETAGGKSTLLRIIHGSEKSNGGNISFDGKDLTDIPKERNFSLIANSNSKNWKDIFSKPSEISAGERQKSSFENELETAHTVILLDNPFSEIEPNLKTEMLNKLRSTVTNQRLSAILVSNDQADLFAVCDRIAVLHRGEIYQIDTPRNLYEQPNSVIAARLLGRNNLIAAMRITFNNQLTQEFQTLAGDHQLLTDKTEKRLLGAINAPVTLAIRPEHISISFGASFPEDNLLKAEIVGIEYQGATTRLKLNANGLILEALVLRLVGLKIGDECMVGLPPDRILVLKD